MNRKHRNLNASAEERFEAALDRWGAELSAWPPELRAQAASVLAVSERANTLLERQRSMDARLMKLRDHLAPPDLAARTLSRLARRDRWQRTFDWFASAFWRPALVACAPLIIGFILGATAPVNSDQELAGQISTLALTDIYQEIADEQH